MGVARVEPAELVRPLLDAVPGGILQFDRSGACVFANAEATRELRLSLDPATGHYRSELGPAYHREDGSLCPVSELPASLVLSTGEAQPPMTLGRASERGMTWAVYHAVPSHDEAGVLDGAYVTFLDMTAQKQAADERRRSEAMWRSLASNVPDFILLLDRERHILSVNHHYPELGGDSGVLGRHNAEYLHEDHRIEWGRQFENVLATGTKAHFETRGLGPNGSDAWYEVTLVPVDALPGASVERVLVVARDITERREILRRLAEKERLASVGMLSASVAHEIMNPLTYVMANLDFALSERCPPGARMTKALLDAREGTARMQQIARDLRSLGRAGSEELFYVDVRSIVETALRLAGPEIARNVTFAVNLSDLPGVLASESRLCQVFINLFVNAAQAMRDQASGERQISVRVRTDDDADLVGIDVGDTGPGIDPANLPRIFDPFFTTKRTGTGLGLSITRDSLEQMGGRIDVTSELGRGTTFTVWLSTRRQHTKRSAPAAKIV